MPIISSAVLATSQNGIYYEIIDNARTGVQRNQASENVYYRTPPYFRGMERLIISSCLYRKVRAAVTDGRPMPEN